MTHLPYTHLFVLKSKSIAISAQGHITVLDTSTGDELISTTKQPNAKICPIVAATVHESSTDGAFLVTAGEDKELRVWKVEGLEVLSERIAPKKPTDVKITKDGQHMLVSDKFGDVYGYPLLFTQSEPQQIVTSSNGLPSSSKPEGPEGPGSGALLLGHVSLLTTFILSPDEKFILTADRDEHIRVSWYPESYVIERYCLGHKKFVSALHIPSCDPRILISGGGDPTLKVWDWMNGRNLLDIDIADTVMPFVKVTRRRPGKERADSGDEGEGGEGTKKITIRERRRLKKRAKKAAKLEAAAEKEADGDEDANGDDASNRMDVDDGPEEADVQVAHIVSMEPGDPLLAVRRIETLGDASSSSQICLFSLFGSTALFYFDFPNSEHLFSSTSNLKPHIKHIDIGKPILDFLCLPACGEVWLLTDGECNESTFADEKAAPIIRNLRLEDSELKLSEQSAAHPTLLSALNSSERLDGLSTGYRSGSIDLYSQLTVLPKNTESEPQDNGDVTLDSSSNKQLSKKGLGRLKAKRARGIALNGQGEGNEAGDAVEGREIKKSKSDAVA